MVLFAMLLEIILEGCVDFCAIQVEYEHGELFFISFCRAFHVGRAFAFSIRQYLIPPLPPSAPSAPGIDLEDFWLQWRKNPWAFAGAHVISDPWVVSFFALMTFRMIPSPVFGCVENDPCSCSGGGFEELASLCAARVNGTLAEEVKAESKALYPSAFSVLKTHAIPVIASVSVVGFIIATFLIARAFNLVEITRSEKEELEESRASLVKQNLEIQKELELSRLSKE